MNETRRNRDTETGRHGDTERNSPSPRVPVSPCHVHSRLRVCTSLLLTSLLLFQIALAQQPRSGAHSTRETFTPADRTTVERAIGTACAERIRDPLGSTPIDEMQARPSLSVNHPDAVAGARRAERLLPVTKRLVANAIVQLAKDYDLYGTAPARARILLAQRGLE